MDAFNPRRRQSHFILRGPCKMPPFAGTSFPSIPRRLPPSYPTPPLSFRRKRRLFFLQRIQATQNISSEPKARKEYRGSYSTGMTVRAKRIILPVRRDEPHSVSLHTSVESLDILKARPVLDTNPRRAPLPLILHPAADWKNLRFTWAGLPCHGEKERNDDFPAAQAAEF